MNNSIADKKCKYCNKAMENIQSARRKYCDDVCRGRFRRKHANETGTYKVSCKYCGTLFRTYNDRKKYCSEKCRLNNNGLINPNDKFKRIKVRYNISCKECEIHFKTTHSSMRFCSNSCRERNKGRHNELKRRKYYLGGDTSISIHKLIVKDYNICYLCGEECDVNDYITDEKGNITSGNKYPSIEHVIPLSKGGEHEWHNVRLAHRICNIRKSNN